jgi:hypothetical protein
MNLKFIHLKPKIMKTKNLLFTFTLLFALFIFQVNAQITVKESFDYDAGDLNGLGVIENGWGGLWATGGDGASTANVVDYNLCPGDEGNSILLDSATVNGAWGAWVKRDLETTWIDDGTTYWLAFYTEMIYKAKSTWWAVQLNLIDQEKLWFGGANETGVFSAFSDDNILSDIPDSVGAKAWLVLKMQMNGNTNADSTGSDSLFLFVNPDPMAEPANSTANASGVTKKLNDGFNNISVWSDGHYKIAFDRIILSTVYNGLGVVSGISKIDDKNEFSVYPTVTSGDLNVKYITNSRSNVDISVYSLTGQKMMTLANNQSYSPADSHIYSVSNLSNGAYILRFSDGTRIYNRKFIVNK